MLNGYGNLVAAWGAAVAVSLNTRAERVEVDRPGKVRREQDVDRAVVVAPELAGERRGDRKVGNIVAVDVAAARNSGTRAVGSVPVHHESSAPERGEIDRFYSELSRILKRYLGGRYRLDLMEHTTAEVPPLLEQAGAPAAAIETTEGCLRICDEIKFARGSAGPPEWKAGVESVYRVVDTTKPVEAQSTVSDRRRSA